MGAIRARIRINVGPEGRAALHEIRGFATRVLGHDTDTDEALNLVIRFVREVNTQERYRIQGMLRRDVEHRVTIPGR